MNLIDTYIAVLDAAKLVVSEDGYVSSDIFGDKKPFTIEGKRLVIPSKDQLRNPDKESRIIFHPLRENPLHYGESPVLSSYRSALNTRLNASIALLFAELIRIASSVALQKKLNPDQSEYLSVVKKADEKSFESLAKLIAAMPVNQTKKAFISIYLKKGGSVDGKKHKKAAIVSFPLYEEILSAKDEIYGVKLRQKDIEVYKNLMEYIFPDIMMDNSYSAGSNSNVAPSLESIMGAVKNVGQAINTQAEVFAGIIDDEGIVVNSDWVDSFTNIETLWPEIKQILPQFGNEPTAAHTEETIEAGSVIPIKEKMEFAGLPRTQQTVFSQPTPTFGHQSHQSGQKRVSLSDAFQGGGIGISQTRVGFNNGNMFQQTTIGQVGFGQNSPFGFNTGRI